MITCRSGFNPTITALYQFGCRVKTRPTVELSLKAVQLIPKLFLMTKGQSMWTCQQTVLDGGSVIKHRVLEGGKPLSYRQILRYWQQDKVFLHFYQQILANTPFEAYFWELPAVTLETVDCLFEFVLVNSPQLQGVASDADSFQQYFSPGQSIVSFENLGKDARLVVPTPEQSLTSYAHLADFSRRVSTEQQNGFWQRVGLEFEQGLSDKPLWVSTSGLGVYWLHVRLDRQPKYYTYQPYKNLVI